VSELDDMRAFVAVVDTGGFGRAGERLGLSKSIVSRRVVRLETDLGARLLDRNTRGVRATEAGREFKARAERILAELEEARDEVAQQGDQVVGQLRVSLPLTFGLKHVAPVLAELAEAHPRLRIDAAYSDRVVDLVAERFDAAVRIGRLEDSSLIARRLAPIREIAVASPAYLARRGRPATPEELNRHDLLVSTGTRAYESWRFRDGRRWVEIRAEGRFQADNGEAVRLAAEAGLGVAVLPTFMVGAAVDSGALVPLLLDFPTPESGLHLVRPPGSHVPGKVRALTDLLVARFAGEPYWDPCHMKSRRAAAEADRAA
jgi:DNA-binding transcriptional LysR family regulator